VEAVLNGGPRKVARKRKRYLVVGIGGRSVGMFIRPMLEQYSDVAELVGLMDINELRMRNTLEDLGIEVPIFTDLDEALRRLRPDRVICTSKDSTHHEVVIKALKAGADAITEKPMTTDDAKCRAILKAEKETGRKVTVTFNYRYAPLATAIRRAIMDGRIGRP
jgi:predicted dehydrogenase